MYKARRSPLQNPISVHFAGLYIGLAEGNWLEVRRVVSAHMVSCCPHHICTVPRILTCYKSIYSPLRWAVHEFSRRNLGDWHDSDSDFYQTPLSPSPTHWSSHFPRKFSLIHPSVDSQSYCKSYHLCMLYLFLIITRPSVLCWSSQTPTKMRAS